MNKRVREDEFGYLMTKAAWLFSLKEYREAEELLTSLIDSTPESHPMFFHLLEKRASTCARLRLWEEAIDDESRARDLNPDDAGVHLNMGVYVTWRLFYSGRFRVDGDCSDLEEAIRCYRACLERNPSSTNAWLNLVETHLFIRRWDDAISHYGLSQPYVSSKEHQTIRAWLGCLALTFAGDPVEKEDLELLQAPRGEAMRSSYDMNQVEALLLELRRIGFPSDRLRKADAIHRLFRERILFSFDDEDA